MVPCETIQKDWVSSLAIVSWCLVEVPRYLYYAINCMGTAPYALTWVRYSLFFVLYPSGISGEVLTMWKSMDYFNGHPSYTMSLPNKWNLAISLYSSIWVFLLVWVWGAPTMYTHMMNQRTKSLAKLKQG